MIYLDNAATTLVKPESVGREMLRAMRCCASPGRGGHRPAMEAAELVFRCRETAARLFHVTGPEQVVFTMNATHALNIAIRSLACQGTRVLISGYEHNSVTRPLRQIGADVRVARGPLFDPAAQLEAFRQSMEWAQLVVCTWVSNVFGYILPVEELAALCRARGVPLIVDASQAAGVLDVDFSRLNASFVAMPGHKGLFGPQGTGMLLCGKKGEPLMSGGSGSDSMLQSMPDYLPDRLEAGTHNVTGIAGLMAGMEYVLEKGTDQIEVWERKLNEIMLEELKGQEGMELFSGPEGTQSGVMSFRIPGMDCEELGQRLAERGICVRSGLHCAPFAHKSAGTLDTGTVRVSFSPFVTEEMVRLSCGEIRELLHTVA